MINYKLEILQNLICLNALKSKIPLKHNFQTYDSRKSSKLESCYISEEQGFLFTKYVFFSIHNQLEVIFEYTHCTKLLAPLLYARIFITL